MKKYISGILIVTLLALAGVFLGAQPARAGYTYSRTIQDCQGSQCPANQTNFTVLVCANGSSPCNASVSGLNQAGGGAHVQNSNGYDIIFSSTSDCNTLMNWEVEKYVASTGELEAWVLVPSLHSAGDTFYMCYGNPSISSFQGGAKGTAWDSNYGIIYHMADNAASTTVLDSTSNANNGTAYANTSGLATSTGQIDGALNVVGQSNNESIKSSSNMNVGGAYTIEGWINQVTTNAFSAWLGQHIGGGNTIFIGTNGTDFYIAAGGTGGTTSQAIPSTGVWFHLAVTYSGGNLTMYYNGTSAYTAGSGTGNTADSPLGIISTRDANTSAKMDEVRMSTSLRSGNWIKTEYNNEATPGTFITFGSEASNAIAPIPHAQVIINKAKAIIKGKTIIY